MSENERPAPRQDVLSWDETFMALACVIKNRSKDPNTQVGACVVTEDNRILSLGYNGAPNGFDDHDMPWEREGETEADTKYAYIVHAEENAILNFRGGLREFSGATLYTTHFCCNGCAKSIVQSGIRHVVYLHAKNNRDLSAATFRIFDATGVTYRQFKDGRDPDFDVIVKKATLMEREEEEVASE